MITETIYYKPQTGKNTKDVLREISTQDQDWLKRVLSGYKELAQIDKRKEFAEWFDKPNPALPHQPKHNNEFNSPRTLCDGVIDKLSQAPNRRDLSPRVCDGIETLSKQMEQVYDENSIPQIRFKDKSYKNATPVPESFNDIFKKIKRK